VTKYSYNPAEVARKSYREDSPWKEKERGRIINKFARISAELLLEDRGAYYPNHLDQLFEEIFCIKISEIEGLFEHKLKSPVAKFTVEPGRMLFKGKGLTFRVGRQYGVVTLERRCWSYHSRRFRYYRFEQCPFLTPKVWFLDNFEQIKQKFVQVAQCLK